MGSRMSFGSGSGDQNAVSELTSVVSHPVPYIPNNHVPVNCQQITEDDTGCSEYDLEVRRGEGHGVHHTGLNQSARESHLPGRIDSEGLTNSEVANEENCQQSDGAASEVIMQGKSQVSASLCSYSLQTTGQSAKVRRKPGHPRKRKIFTKNILVPESVGPNAVQHQEDVTATSCEGIEDSMPTSSENHCSHDVPWTSDGQLVNHLPHSERSGYHCMSDSRPEVIMSVMKKRGRPRKDKSPVSESNFTDENSSGSTWSLRKRQRPALTTDEKTESDDKVTLTARSASSVKSNCHHIDLADEQIPAKLFKPDFSQEASTVLRSDTGDGEKTGTDKQVSLNSEDQMSCSSHGTSPECDRPPHARISSTVKAEETEIELDHLNSMSQIDEVLQNDGSMTECANSQANIYVFTRGKERRRHALLPREHLPPPNEPTEGNSNVQPTADSNTQQTADSDVQQTADRDTQQTVDDDAPKTVDIDAQQTDGNAQQTADGDAQQTLADTKEEDNTNPIYTKRGGKTLLKCGFCGRVCKFLSQFIIHQRIHTGEKPFKCLECGRCFSKNSNLNLHLKVHRKNNAYQTCPYCKIRFSYCEYSSHIKTHAHELHKESEKDKSQRQGSDISKSVELVKSAAPEKKPCKVCKYCGKMFTFPSALIRHERVHTGEKPYKCDICGKAFGQAYFLRVHELTHWSVKRYNCTRCGKSFTHYSNARNHICRTPEIGEDCQYSRRPKPSLTYTCHICKNVFGQLQEFNNHMKAHTGAKLYRCVCCDKLFGVLSEFKEHQRQCAQSKGTESISGITEEEPVALIQYTLPAKRCSSVLSVTPQNCQTQKKTPAQTRSKKPFSNSTKPFQPTNIPPHHLSHFVSKLNTLDNRSDPRKYFCPRCGRLFRHMGRLRAHMLSHPRSQNYTCSCCGKSVDNWKQLWRHQRVHRQRHGRFTCPQCGRGFRFVEPYKRHMSEHSEVTWNQVRPRKVFLPYQCEQCRSRFRTLDLLFKHQLCHAPAQDVHKYSDFDLSVDVLGVQTNIMSSPAIDNCITGNAKPKESNFSPALFVQTWNSPLNSVSISAQTATSGLPLAPVISLVQKQTFVVGKTIQHPGNALLIHGGENGQDNEEANNFGNLIPSPLRMVKEQAQDANKSNKCGGPAEDIRCTVCGRTYSVISDLYYHYLQHARGQL
ncbi:zinc finger protein 184 [Thalassophryne amazonica]|uniref:zinc finger protein 184 n=1 Tax=Thalassophryne amazonica TaxID=390379 RepID=UPI0014725B7F|nr:zinc finger protein 184 [Thalassophryne amazonica]